MNQSMRALASILALMIVSLPCHADLPSYAPVVAMHADVSERVTEEQFDGLLQDADRFQRSQERFPDGRWKLAVFYRGLRDGFLKGGIQESDWTRYQSKLLALTNRYPKSSNAWLMLAAMYDGHAWAVRGGGYANTVSEEGNARFHALLEQSREVLERHKAVTSGNPQWYALRINIGGSAGDDPAKLDAVFSEALRKSPNYQQTWFSRLHFLTPKWGGTTETMVAFITRAARFPSPTDGTGLTARLLWFAEGDGYPVLVEQPGIDWAVVKKSYDDVLDRFPVDFNAQHFAVEACFGKFDKTEATRLVARVKTVPTEEDNSREALLYRTCVAWTQGKIPESVLHPSTAKPRVDLH